MKGIEKSELIFRTTMGKEYHVIIHPREEKRYEDEEIEIQVDSIDTPRIRFQLKEQSELIESVKYRFTLPMCNYSGIIVPDSGRWFLRYMSLIDFWKSHRNFSSTISDIKTPLFIFLNSTGNAELAIGIIGKNWETSFSVIEPESNRALNVHTGHIVLEIEKGSVSYPIELNHFEERMYLYSADETQGTSWPLIQRAFANYQRKDFKLLDPVNEAAIEPIWCSWVDWDSSEITSKMLLENMKEGVKLGIKNFIIDDGWYGNGLDSDYATEMNIGDWEPDAKKIPDMGKLVEDAHKIDARAVIWCAPHAVAKKSKAYQRNYKLLLSDEHGNPVINEPQYYSYCLCCKESRKVMSDICINLQEKWNFDGAKYDLFNWIPDIKCRSPYHKHDINSTIEGLELLLKDVYERTNNNNPNHIIELKQNYGTVFISRYGHLMRSGDSPFDGETNFQRTLHIQSYTNNALNDYQSFTKYDTEKDIAVAIIKMMSVGVPAYGVNFRRLSEKALEVIKHYNIYFHDHKELFKNARVPVDSDSKTILIDGDNEDVIFRLAENRIIKCDGKTTIFNGIYSSEIVVLNQSKSVFRTKSYDCAGRYVSTSKIGFDMNYTTIPIGGMLIMEEM